MNTACARTLRITWYIILVLLGLLGLVRSLSAAENHEYPAWLLSQMPDINHLMRGYEHLDDGFPVAAIQKFELASRYGNLRARVEIGRMYLEGDGVEIDHVRAYTWFTLAEMVKHSPWRGTQSPRQRLKPYMSDEELKLANERIVSHMAEHGPEIVTERILTWLRRDKHKNREFLSRYSIAGNTVRSGEFRNRLTDMVIEQYLPDTEVILRELEIHDSPDSLPLTSAQSSPE